MLDKAKKSRLIWHCRRGMLELDLILGRFINTRLDQLNEDQLQQFEALLEYTDPELFAWLMGNEIPPTEELIQIVNSIRNTH